MNKTKTILNSAIVLYFIIGLEILIMISPFAGFFYSVFNPFLLQTAQYPATRWLSAFFLPHWLLKIEGDLSIAESMIKSLLKIPRVINLNTIIMIEMLAIQ